MKKVFCIHPQVHDVNSFLNYLHLEENLEVVWDSECPDILFASEWIYYQKDAYELFCALYEKAKIKVFLGFEAISPDFNLFDYAIGFDNHLQNRDRFIRIMSPFDMYHEFISTRKNEITSTDQAQFELKSKKSFCNFLYSNPNAHPMRDRLFYELSHYKQVDSLGRHLNNVNKPGTGFAGFSKDCVPIKRSYKFSIASENAVYSGYTSEKIITSLEAHTVPIYFGNPDIVQDINKDAFINVNDFNSLESLMEYVKFVDHNDDIWCKYVSSPWLTKMQEEYHLKRTADYQSKLIQILSGNIDEISRLPLGTHQSYYRQNFLQHKYPFNPKKNWKYYAKKVLKSLNIH